MTTPRDTSLLAIRPQVQADALADVPGSAGNFLHATLRPILKFQNELLLQTWRLYSRKRKINLQQVPPHQRLSFIEERLSQDTALRCTLIGQISGYFTVEEWILYQEMEAEINRRITGLLAQRFYDQLDTLPD